MDFEWRVVVQNQDLIWAGMVMTVVIATISFVLSLGLGLVISLFRLSRIKLISLLAAGYINLFRAIPQLVFIVYIYYGVSIAIGINFSPIMAGVTALTLQYSAWLAEIFRSGIQAVSPGQREAALAVGMSRIGAFVTITLPQAFRIVIPPTGNTAVGIIKGLVPCCGHRRIRALEENSASRQSDVPPLRVLHRCCRGLPFSHHGRRRRRQAD